MAEQKPVRFHPPESKPSKSKKIIPDSYMSKMASFFFSSYKFLSTFMGKGVESDKKARDKNKWEDF